MSNICVNNLTYRYDSSYELIFDNVSFIIDESWKLGLIARNGRGKTTLLNLLMKKYEYSGTVTSSISFSYFPYSVKDETLNVIDIVGDDYLIYRELSLLQVSQEVLFRPFNTLSQGEKTKVLLAMMFLKENNFLLIDEPTNHLDQEGRNLLSNYLKKKKGFILVSHDRNFIDNCVDHIMSINKTGIEIVGGNFTSWNSNRELNENLELRQNEKIKHEIQRLSKSSSEKAEWSHRIEATKSRKVNPDAVDKGYIGHQAAKMMKRSKGIEKRIESQIEQKEKLLRDIEIVSDLTINPLKFHSKKMIYGKSLSIEYCGKTIFKNLDFEIVQGQKINVKGKNGSGKSSLLKLILGEGILYTGEYFKANGLIISYVSQDISGVIGKLTEFEKEHEIDITLFRTILRKLDFSRDAFNKDMSYFSDGQKKKILIAKSLSQKAHLYIWDEPLNYIDVLSRMQIEKLLQSSNMTLLFVEHDVMFCQNIATNTIIINKTSIQKKG